MGKRGRKNKYDEVIKPRLEEIKKLLKEGYSQKAIAEHIGVSVLDMEET